MERIGAVGDSDLHAAEAEHTAEVGTGDSSHAKQLDVHPKEWSFGPTNFGGETNFHPGYREWRRLLQRAAGESE